MGGARDLQMILCHSMKAGSVVGDIPSGCGHNQTLPYDAKKLFELFAGGGDKIFRYKHLHLGVSTRTITCA